MQNEINNPLNKNRESSQPKDFYNSSVLNNNIVEEMLKDITNTETLDINVEKVKI